MMRFCLMMVALTFPGLVGAKPYVYPYNWMTGEEVVAKLLKVPVTDADFRDRDLTHHYLNGIKDGTQGIIWCFSAYILPHELNKELVAAIKATRTGAELKGNAGPLIRDELRRVYPCGPSQGSRP